MSIDVRTKMMDKEKMKKAIELYFRALEYDKYNALVLNVNKDCSITVQKEDGSLDYLNSGEVRIVINK